MGKFIKAKVHSGGMRAGERKRGREREKFVINDSALNLYGKSILSSQGNRLT